MAPLESHEPQIRQRSTREIWLLTALLTLGLAARIVLSILRPGDLLLDADGYLGHAAEFLATGTYGGPYSHVPTAFRPPAYPLLLATFQAVGCSAWTSVLLIHLIAVSIVVLCVWRLSEGTSSHVRLLITGVVLFDPLLLRYSLLPMTEVPCAAALLLAVTAYVRARGTSQGRTAWRCVTTSGLLFAFGALIRPTVAVCVVLVLATDVILGLRNSSHDFRAALRRAIVAGLLFGMGLSPWIIRNYVQFQKLIPATTHGGYTLALGNNPNFYRDVINGKDEFPWDGDALDRWQQRTLSEARAGGTNVLNETELDAWYSNYAMASMRENPAAAFHAIRLRLRRFWALSTADSNSRLLTISLSLWYGFLWAGLILRLLFIRRRKLSASEWLFCACVLAFVLLHSVYWTDTRMRTPVMPMLTLLSAFGWCKAVETVRGGGSAVTGNRG